MKKLYNIILLIGFTSLIPVAGNGQVIMKEFLSQNHMGQLDKSVNNAGKPLYYKFEYVSTEGMRINYKLNLYKDKAMAAPWMTMPVLMRNLNWTYYVDITMTKDGSDKVAAMIFKKDLRWSRVKFSPHEGCWRNEQPEWERFTIGAESETPEILYASVINNFLMQLDRNVDFNCYAASTPH